MQKLKWILLSIWLLCYLIVLKDPVRMFFVENWKLISIAVGVGSLLFLLIRFIAGRGEFTKLISNKNIPKALFAFNVVTGFISAIILLFSISVLVPLFLLYTLEKYKIIHLDTQLNIYTILTLVSMIVTFVGKIFLKVVNRYLLYNPSEKNQRLVEFLFSEDIIKTICFGLYFIALIVQAIIKFEHLDNWVLTEDTTNAVVLAFATYIALDRIITTFRRARQLKTP